MFSCSPTLALFDYQGRTHLSATTVVDAWLLAKVKEKNNPDLKKLF